MRAPNRCVVRQLQYIYASDWPSGMYLLLCAWRVTRCARSVYAILSEGAARSLKKYGL